MTDQELLTLVKSQCSIDESFTGDDAYLTQLIAAAKEVVEWQIDAPPAPPVPPNEDAGVGEEGGEGGEGEDPEPEPTPEYDPPKSVLQALLMLVAQWYRNREISGDDKSLAKSYDYLLSAHRHYSV